MYRLAYPEIYSYQHGRSHFVAKMVGALHGTQKWYSHKYHGIRYETATNIQTGDIVLTNGLSFRVESGLDTDLQHESQHIGFDEMVEAN
jgi:hypothetical protein